MTGAGSDTSGFDDLRRHLREIAQLEHAAILLSWDQEVCMPPGGVSARGGSIGLLRTLIHERWLSRALGRLLERLEGAAPPGSVEEALVRVTLRQREVAARLTPELIGRRSRLSSEARPIWRRARADSDWSAFAPVVSRVVDLNRELADAIGYDEHPYDALLELSDPGMTTARLRVAFSEIQAAADLLAPSRLEAADRAELLTGEWGQETQLAFIRRIATWLGADLTRGRIDLSAYPIANKIALGDIRMTTNLHARQVLRGVFGALHELGHVIYAHGLDPAFAETPLWGSPSFGIDESQSRLFENMLGRSRAFWVCWLPRLRESFPGQADRVEVETLYESVNRISSTPILLDADELSYNLHILVRFEIECGLLDGSLDVGDVPEAWREGMRRSLGVDVRNDGEGPLQDIHWAGCYMGAFTSYTVGDLVAAQLMASARRALPDLDAQLESGEPSELLGWLRANVHAHGARFTPEELVIRATGEELSTRHWVEYITEKAHSALPASTR
jgi:carboxypeptidase Taq